MAFLNFRGRFNIPTALKNPVVNKPAVERIKTQGSIGTTEDLQKNAVKVGSQNIFQKFFQEAEISKNRKFLIGIGVVVVIFLVIKSTR